MRLPSNCLVCLDLKGVSKRAPGGICTNLRPSNLLKARILILGAPQITVSCRVTRPVSCILIIGVSYFRSSVLNRGLEIARARMLGGLHGRPHGTVADWRGSCVLLPVAQHSVGRRVCSTVYHSVVAVLLYTTWSCFA